MNADLLAQISSQTYYEVEQLGSLVHWWQWLLLAAIVVAVLAVVAAMYWYDSVELPRGVAATLMVLRVLAFVGLLVFFFNIEKRSQRKIVKNSRAALLFDTSQSMGLRDSDATTVTSPPNRIEPVAAELAAGQVLEHLRARHDVVAYRFDAMAQPAEVASLPKRSDEAAAVPTSVVEEERRALAVGETRRMAVAALCVLGLSVVAFAVWFAVGRMSGMRATAAWALFAAEISLVAAAIVLAVGNLRNPEVSWQAVVGLPEPARQSPDADDDAASPDDEKPASPIEDGAGTKGETKPAQDVDWQAELLPRGAETRIGDAMRYLINRERGGPIAGIVVFTDGCNNAGTDPAAVALIARDAHIPIYAVGLGSNRRPTNVRVVDVEAPPRVYPGDEFSLVGLLRADGLQGQTVKVELYSAPSAGPGTSPEDSFEQETSVALPEDGKEVSVRFELTPDEQGRRVYKLRVSPPPRDHDPRDNEKTVTVDVVERKNHVLLLAGGPMRDYQFLRNQLFRDRDTTVDVLLQTGAPGMSQEADELLYEFPQTADELFDYDCIVAFDPDWEQLDEVQVDLLERWIGEKAGGMVVIAGPVYMAEWTSLPRDDRRMNVIRALYPVVLFQRGTVSLQVTRQSSDTAWPLEFTRDGLESEFLWLEESAADSEQAWARFPGVYGYFPVKEPKPGARVLAQFSDPEASIDDDLPVYLATQYYGAGRVVFQASGEMWRLRGLDERYFEQYYTKLIRWASQGRLLRDSSRGVLLVDKERCLLGDQISVRGTLYDAQHRPLDVDEVSTMLLRPDGTRTNLALRRIEEGAREGTYAAQFTVLQEGDYRVELKVPESSEDELLTAEVRVRLPDIEVERPERNDALLQTIATTSGGVYYVGLDAAVGRGGGDALPLVNQLEPQDQETYLQGTPDRTFKRLLMAWLLGLTCGVLCLEWLTRRLNKLA